MEVIHLILGKANPLRMNGVNKVVHELATRQQAAGFAVSVWGVTSNTAHDYPERNFNTVLYRKKRFSFAMKPSLKAAIKAMSGRAVFHLHGGFIPLMYRAAAILDNNGIPFVFTPHGSYNTLAMHKSGKTKKIYTTLFERRMLARACTIHVLGASEITGLRQWFPNEKTVRIPYGFELPLDGGEGREPSLPFTIGFCGRIDVFTKGLDALIPAFAQFHQDHPGTRLSIIGDGPELSSLKELAEKAGIAQAITFHGARYGTDKMRLLKQCDVFAHPSRNEGLPTAVLEAASLGIPCLVTEATNTGEGIRRHDAGLAIPETDAGQIAAALGALHDRIVNGGEKEALGENAIQMIRQGYSWELLLKEYQTMYRNAFAG